MKKILFFELKMCPHCRKARRFLEELYEENPQYREIEIEFIEERKNKEIAKQYDYYFVPTLYLDGVKVHEGKMFSKEELEEILKKALA